MNKYEQLIEFIINEQEDKARDLFHQLVVEKSRDIYESLIDEQDFDEDIGGNLRGNLGQSAGSVGVIDPRENRGSARSFDGGDDARVIRGNDHGVE